MSFEQAVVQLEQTNASLQAEVIRFRDAAMGLNAIYATITEGRQAVAEGKYFSVPGNGAYMRLYRRQGSSAELIAEFPDRAQVQGIVDVFGGRGVTGPGDLMARGFGGLGGVPPAINTFETPLLTGFYRVVGANLADFPIGRESLLAYSTCVSIIRYNNIVNRLSFTADSQNQELFLSAHNENGELSGRIARFYSNVNILGTVSQSGGMPAGAIIEQGSTTSGGRYRKFADGTMECWKTFEFTDMGSFGSGTFGDLYRSGAQIWDFPQQFITPPEVSGMCCCNSALATERANIVCASTVSETRVNSVQVFRVSNALGSQLPVKVTLTASGRWRA